jgi:hypothetical protein
MLHSFYFLYYKYTPATRLLNSFPHSYLQFIKSPLRRISSHPNPFAMSHHSLRFCLEQSTIGWPPENSTVSQPANRCQNLFTFCPSRTWEEADCTTCCLKLNISAKARMRGHVNNTGEVTVSSLDSAHDFFHLQAQSKTKAIPVKGREGPQGCETSRLPHFLHTQLKDGGKVVSLTRRPAFYPMY